MANNPIKLVDVGALDRFKTDIENEIPKSIQYSTMPTASANLVDKIMQYTGSTTASYTNGYFYKCVPGSTAGTYEWVPVAVQEGGGGGGGGEILITPRLELRPYLWEEDSYAFDIRPYHISASNRNIIDAEGLYESYPLYWDECGIRMRDYIVNNGEISSITFECQHIPSSILYFRVVSMPVTVIS